jgi:hypothetical protein
MKLDQVELALRLCFNSNVTPALVGTSGVGKTSIPKQLYTKLGFDTFITIRPSLIADVGDLVGLPDFDVIVHNDGSEEKRTTFNSPDWLPKKDQKALVVIDEINRTQKDIIMAMFDLIEAEHPKIGKYSLPKGSKVIATLNPPTDEYTVLDIKDKAFTSRLCLLKVMPDKQVFLEWGAKDNNLTNEMMDFLIANDEFFGLGEKFEVEMFGLDIKNNNRSKKKVSDLYKTFKTLGLGKENTPVLYECIQGIGGKEFASAFLTFVESYNDVVTWEDILHHTPKAQRLDYNNLAVLSKINDDFKVAFRDKKINKENFTAIADYLAKIPADTFQGFIDFFVAETDDKGNALDFDAVVIEFTDYLGTHEGILNKVETIKNARKEIQESNENTTTKKV